MANQVRVSTDKNGNPYQVKALKEKEKDGARWMVGYVELNGKLYQVKVTGSNKEGVAGWMQVKLLKNQQQKSSM